MFSIKKFQEHLFYFNYENIFLDLVNKIFLLKIIMSLILLNITNT